MANVKITELTALTDPASTDVLPIVDVVADVTKKISIADLLENAGSGTAAAPGIAFDGDSNTGIYRPGADQLAFATNGAQALYINADGNILVADGNRMEIDEIRARDGAGLKLFDDAGAGIFVQDGGNVGVGTSSPTQALELGTAGGSAGNILVPAGATIFSGGDLYLRAGTSGKLRIGADDTNDLVTLDTSGRLGIGTTSPSSLLHLEGTDGVAQIRLQRAGTNIYGIIRQTSAPYGLTYDAVDGNSADPTHTFRTSTDGSTFYERARIDSSGRLLVGTSSARSDFGSTTAYRVQVEGTDLAGSSLSLTRNTNSNAGPGLQFAKSRASANGGNVIVQNNDVLAYILFDGNDGADFARAAQITAEVDGTPGANDMPGRLVFSTTADGASSPTERMRIDSSGNIKAATSCDFLPSIDAGFSGHSDLGDPSLRFEDAYVRDGVTTGSDRNYKSEIRELSDAERAVAASCKRLLRAWKWTQAVASKGSAARTHVGIIAQDLEQAFSDQGLDAHDYAMFCEDTWYEVDGKKEDDNGSEYTADSDGAVAVTRLSVRYHELLAFIIAAI